MSEELAKRAVACRHWRWMPGMQSIYSARYLGGDRWVGKGGDRFVHSDPNDGDLPDLNHPATLGCLLALVREAWGRRVTFECGPNGEDAYIRIVPPHDERAFGPKFRGSTIAAALVAALEDAP